MNEEFIEFLVRNLFNAVILAFIFSWIISFILKKDMYQELKKRIRAVLSVIIFIALFFIEIAPFESEAKQMMKEWYPNVKKITIITIEKSKVKKNAYNGYVQWEQNNKKCKGILLITKEKKTSESWWYELPRESISCQPVKATTLSIKEYDNSWTEKQKQIYKTTPTNRIVMESIVNENNKEVIIQCFEKKLMSKYTYSEFVQNIDSDYFLFKEIPQMTKDCILENKQQ